MQLRLNAAFVSLRGAKPSHTKLKQEGASFN